MKMFEFKNSKKEIQIITENIIEYSKNKFCYQGWFIDKYLVAFFMPKVKLISE